MRLSASRGAYLTLALCLATTTICAAFLSPSTALSSAKRTRGHHLPSARCVERVPMKMSAMRDHSCPSVKQRGPGLTLVATLFRWRPGARRRGRPGSQVNEEAGVVVRAGEKQRRGREIVVKSMTALVTAVIVRSTFLPQPAYAVSGLRGRSAREQRLEKQRREEKAEAAREKLMEKQRKTLETSTTADAKSTAIKNLAGTDSSVDDSLDEDASLEEATPDRGQMMDTEGITRSAADGMSERKSGLPDTMEEQVIQKKALQTAAKPKAKRDTSDKTRMGAASSAAIGGFALYNIISSVKGSSDIMGKQRRRVRVESAKFDQQKDEFMNVEGEAAVDVDMMKELRDMKEKMAGPGDKYAKETRKYNPEFAADHPDDEYDAKIEEALKSKAKKETRPKRGKTGIVFTSDEYDASMAAASADAKDDDLLGNGEGDGDEAEDETLNRVQSQAAARAAQAKKDEDVKRLQKLFNDSPSDDNDSPEDDLGDKRELLP